jgi:hypothetical protein
VEAHAGRGAAGAGLGRGQEVGRGGGLEAAPRLPPYRSEGSIVAEDAAGGC